MEELQIAGPIQLPVLLADGHTAHFVLYLFRMPKSDYYVLEKGVAKGKSNILLRVHSACNIAHIFHSQRCDCQAQLELAMEEIDRTGCGLLIYAMAHEGRAVGAFDHVRVYQKQDEGYDTVDSYISLDLPVDGRDYSEVGDILQWFELENVRLLTNNPRKIEALEAMGFTVERVPLIVKLDPYNQSQIMVKIRKLGHLIPEIPAI